MRRAGLSDTSPEAERVMAACFRALTPSQKWKSLGDNHRTARLLHAAGVRFRNPKTTDQEIHRSWLAQILPPGPWMDEGKAVTSNEPAENLAVVRAVVSVLDRMGIAYALGGSFASSIYGESRQTRDADLSVEPFPGREAAFAASFGTDYYVSVDAIRQAIRERSTFNIINIAAGFKVDLFVRRDRAFDGSILSRKIAMTFADVPSQPIFVVTPEDILLLKLEWYRLGGEASDRQWRDVIGILHGQVDRMDDAYLHRWAADLGVTDLLEQARTDASH